MTCSGVVCAAESCVSKGQVLNRGACAGFTSYFRNNPNCAADATTFRAAVVAGPPPSAACAHACWSSGPLALLSRVALHSIYPVCYGLVSCAPASHCSH